MLESLVAVVGLDAEEVFQKNEIEVKIFFFRVDSDGDNLKRLFSVTVLNAYVLCIDYHLEQTACIALKYASSRRPVVELVANNIAF